MDIIRKTLVLYLEEFDVLWKTWLYLRQAPPPPEKRTTKWSFTAEKVGEKCNSEFIPVTVVVTRDFFLTETEEKPEYRANFQLDAVVSREKFCKNPEAFFELIFSKFPSPRADFDGLDMRGLARVARDIAEEAEPLRVGLSGATVMPFDEISREWQSFRSMRWYLQTVTVENGDECCAICLQELVATEVSRLECSHQYHYHCIHDWLARAQTCPTCRFQLLHIPMFKFW